MKKFIIGSALFLGTLAFSVRQNSMAAPTPHPAYPTVTLAAVGDILLDRGVAKAMGEHGFTYPFSGIAKELSRPDLTFANLECPVAEQATKVMKPFCFKARPAATIGLQTAGVDLVSLANNHSLDCGRSGLVETMQNMQKRGIRWCGAGQNLSAAETPAIVTVNGLRIAWVGFCEFVPEGVFLQDEKPSIALATPEAIKQSVALARKQADIVIVSIHWGVEYAARPRAHQLDWAKIAVDAGADVVLGHHPHVLQGLQVQTRRIGPHKIRRSLVAYSLGNFVFDSPRAWDRRTAQTIVLNSTFDRNGLRSVTVLPVVIERCRPRPAQSNEASPILSDITKLSKELNTQLRGSSVVLPNS